MDKPIEASDDTRERLLRSAVKQFAERGFYGASIAQIAGELDLTKQALLYYFKRKEDLYAEVIRRISERLMSAVRAGVNETASPEEQFEQIIVGVFRAAMQNPSHSRVLMRELLDNQRQDAPRESWYLKTFLDAMVARLDQIDGMAERSFSEKLSAVYQLISAIEFFASSQSVLTRFYGEEEYAQISANFPDQLRSQVRRLIGND